MKLTRLVFFRLPPYLFNGFGIGIGTCVFCHWVLGIWYLTCIYSYSASASPLDTNTANQKARLEFPNKKRVREIQVM